MKDRPRSRCFDLCAVTGDLGQSPDAVIFAAVRDQLARDYPDGFRVVPGNHDLKTLGNFFPRRKPFWAAFPAWGERWHKREAAAILLPVDSNAQSSGIPFAVELARGKVDGLQQIRKSLEVVHAELIDEFTRQVTPDHCRAFGALFSRDDFEPLARGAVPSSEQRRLLAAFLAGDRSQDSGRHSESPHPCA